ncbi:hypothetical protein WJX72_007221 [[Myrmecia] bisecta]|uniref:Ribosome production factor 2 homolog n=1 Tax=[Myrmecia] bisecta TaxID=41462 RepID=A0AAW1Q4M1_9CHLO
MSNLPPQTTIIKPKTQRGKRILQKREPKLVEDAKKALLLFGNKTSQVVKDVLTDLQKLKAKDAVKYSRKNDDVRPFEAGGESHLEFFSRKNDLGLFCLGTHSKKRPHNLVFGRFYDHRLYDMVELGVERFKSLKAFGSAPTHVQAGNKPCFIFAGEQFENQPDFRLAKTMLLDFFRGQQVQSVNLKGIDHVILVSAVDKSLLFRQYAIHLKKSGFKIPRVELTEMGPSLDLSLRRVQQPSADLQKEALRKPKELQKKKVRNTGSDMLAGKVGRIYMPKQDVGEIALHKMKGVKRQRQEQAAEKAGAPKKDGKRPAKRQAVAEA